MGHQIKQALSKSEIFDYIIIGSGFGGSVSALRLAEKGYRVLVLEKGKGFSPYQLEPSEKPLDSSFRALWNLGALAFTACVYSSRNRGGRWKPQLL